MKKFLIIIPIIAFVCFRFLSSKKQATTEDVFVNIETVKKGDMPIELIVPGIAQSSDPVLIRSRADGIVKKIHFKEGDIVKKGDPLISLDDTDLQAQLAKAIATLAKDQALLEHAVLEVKRNEKLIKDEIITSSDFDKLTSDKKSLEATVMADKAQIDSLKAQISYTKIDAPIDGFTGFQIVKEGNFVRTLEGNTLVSIMPKDTLDIEFKCPDSFLNYLNKEITATLLDQNSNIIAENLNIKTLENKINSESGTLSLKVSLSSQKVMPGQYLKGILKLGSNKNVITIPISALQIGPKGYFVFVLDKDTVHFRDIKIISQNNKIASVSQGLKDGEIVVTLGQIRLRDGMKVHIS